MEAANPESVSRLAFVDAHHHLWDLQACHYPWLMARGVKRFFGDPTPIQKNYLVDDLLRESRRYRPTKSVHIQVGVKDSHSIRESQWLQQQSQACDGFPHAIVAYCDLASQRAEQDLDEQQSIAGVRGVRQIIGRHEKEDKQTGSGKLLDDRIWRGRLKSLARRNLSFDLQLVPSQLAQAYAVFSKVPELHVALCHCGSPWDQSVAGLERWRAGLRKLACLPNMYCKISGLGMFNRDWNEAQLRPLILDVIEIFGTSRSMFGSNFPVDKLYRSYDAYWAAYDSITSGFSAVEREQLFSGTATKFYALQATA